MLSLRNTQPFVSMFRRSILPELSCRIQVQPHHLTWPGHSTDVTFCRTQVLSVRDILAVLVQPDREPKYEHLRASGNS